MNKKLFCIQNIAEGGLTRKRGCDKVVKGWKDMANRTKTERDKKILDLWDNGKGWRQKSIARMFKMTESAVSMIIYRAKRKESK